MEIKIPEWKPAMPWHGVPTITYDKVDNQHVLLLCQNLWVNSRYTIIIAQVTQI